MSAALTIAVDGPAASGKGTVSRRLAARYGLDYLDTGLLYRAIGKRMLDGAEPVAAARDLDPAVLDDPALRSAEVAKAASEVAAIGAVRAALVDFQRAFAARPRGAVLDGRDIGTVICPGAPVKLFITAAPEIRAHRRWLDLHAAGSPLSEADVLADIAARDARDQGRADAPLAAAADAVILDTSDMGIDEAVDSACRAVEAVRRV